MNLISSSGNVRVRSCSSYNRFSLKFCKLFSFTTREISLQQKEEQDFYIYITSMFSEKFKYSNNIEIKTSNSWCNPNIETELVIKVIVVKIYMKWGIDKICGPFWKFWNDSWTHVMFCLRLSLLINIVHRPVAEICWQEETKSKPLNDWNSISSNFITKLTPGLISKFF